MKKMKKQFHLYWLIPLIVLTGILFLAGCHKRTEKITFTSSNTLIRKTFFLPDFNDDMDVDTLITAIQWDMEYLNRLDPNYQFCYGPDRYTCKEVKESYENFLDFLKKRPDRYRLDRYIKNNFIIYKAAGKLGTGKVLFTGYFEPIFQARRKKSKGFKYPIYRLPDDLVTIDLSPFGKKFKGEKIIARIEGKNVLPYYTRAQIDTGHVLDGRGLEMAWLQHPVDRLFLQIQGSGRLIFPDGSMVQVGYHASNGQPYRSIGRYMIEKGYLKKDEVSMQRIHKFITEHPELADDIINHNPSYVFFRFLDNGPLGNINVPLTPGRSIALDSRLFPKGALGFIRCQKPLIDQDGNIIGWKNFSRFVVNQDTGGAIKGPGRADIFWGMGKYARTVAGHLKREGDLYIIIKRPGKNQQ